MATIYLQDLLTQALLEINKISPNDTMSPTMASIGMIRLNLVMDSWNADVMKIWGEVPYAFPLVGGTQTYAMGADQVAPNFTMPRPTGPRDRPVEKVNLLIEGGTPSTVRTPIKILNYEQWASISVNNVGTTSGYPVYCYCDNSFNLSPGGVPYSNISFWTFPGTGQSVEIWTRNQLTQFTALDNLIEFPPSYGRALLLQTAVEIASAFGCQPSPSTISNLRDALDKLEATNAQSPLASPVAGYPGRTGNWDFCIYSGDTSAGSWPPQG